MLGGTAYALLVFITTLGRVDTPLGGADQGALALLAWLQLVPLACLGALLGAGLLAGLRRLGGRLRPGRRGTRPAATPHCAPGAHSPRAAAWRLGTGSLLLGLALGAHIADLLLYVRLYAWAHALLALASLLLAPAALACLAPHTQDRLAAPRRAGALAHLALLLPLPGLVCGQLLLVGHEARRVVAFHQATGLSQALGLWTTLVDRDGDGFSPLFGAGDCDDGRADRHPFRQEPPGSPQDVDCSGGVTALRAARAPAGTSALHGALAPSRGGVQPGVLLLTYDALRVDRLRRNGGTRDLVPNFERLAAEGSYFGNAYSPACWTLPAVWGLLTGRDPRHVPWTPVMIDSDNRVRAAVDPESTALWQPRFSRQVLPVPLNDPLPALPDLLRAAGVQSLTATSYLLFRKGAGISDRFDVVEAGPARAIEARPDALAAPMVAQAGIELLARHAAAGEPFFLWLHFLDPHAPYLRAPSEPDFGSSPGDRYDTELWRVDRAVGTLLAWMQAQGLLQRTLVIAAADHGEAFGEHGTRWHASSLYDEQSHVPLLIRLPGPPRPATVWQPVSLVDVAPTVLELLGLPLPPELDGRSLLPLLAGEPWAPRPVALECFRFEHRLLGLFDGRYKLIDDLRFDTLELYDLQQDPAETANLADERPAELARLRQALQRWRERRAD